MFKNFNCIFLGMHRNKLTVKQFGEFEKYRHIGVLSKHASRLGRLAPPKKIEFLYYSRS